MVENISKEMEVLNQLMILAYRRMNCISEVLKLTEEIGESLDRNDRVSVQMLLGMREKELDNIEDIRKKIYLLLDCTDDNTATEYKEYIKLRKDTEALELVEVDSKDFSEDGIKKKIQMYSDRCSRILEKVIAADRHMSMRLGGKDSYYK